MKTMSPSASRVGSPIARPLTRVRFLLPRSRTSTPWDRRSKRACRPETRRSSRDNLGEVASLTFRPTSNVVSIGTTGSANRRAGASAAPTMTSAGWRPGEGASSRVTVSGCGGCTAVVLVVPAEAFRLELELAAPAVDERRGAAHLAGDAQDVAMETLEQLLELGSVGG